MMGDGWRHQEAEPSCGFVDESFGPAHALRAVHTRGPLAHNSTGPTTKFFHKTPAPPDPMSSIQTNRLARNHPSRS